MGGVCFQTVQVRKQLKMAAAGCAGSVSRLGQQAKARPGAVSNHRHVRYLTLEEARCPVCLEILLEPVTMPCRHSVCLHCFKRTVECSGLCCPSCRLRVSSWARNKQSREKSLVNTELWDMVRQSYPERCGRRLEQRDRVMASEDVFCSPLQICKPGDMRHENDKQKNKAMLMDEETEERMKKLPCWKKGESGLQHSQDISLGVLSDSENEEPMRMRTRHASAFVRKSRISPALCRSLYNISIQRSQSCTDSEEGRRKVRDQSHLSLPEKASIGHSFNAGILLSSENSRSFSAPVLPLDKRHHWRSILATPPSSLIPHSKPERSVSPESNDSISEELNHFKPIVCSPCTPPKRLPDGRLMEPTIVKSTPRNLTHSLQKSTSYEASPSILQKWKQVELDRQRVKFMSKGTITSPVADDHSITQSSEEDQENKSCNCGPMEKGLQGQHCICTANTNLSRKQREKSLLYNKWQLIFDQCSRDDSQSTNAHPTLMALGNSDAQNHCGACESHCSPSGRVENLKSPILDKHMEASHNQSIEDLQDLKNEPTVRSCVLNRPTSRRGKKRSQKTKHLEETKRIKISNVESCESCDPQYIQNDLYVERIQQERMDRELALKLQRQFDEEGQKVERHRMSSDKYLLRSWICVDGRAARNPRRSGRISRKIKHFN